MKKSGPQAALVVNEKGWRGRAVAILLEPFLREPGADGGTLTGFEFRVGLADHIDGALALYDLAIGVAAFGGGEG